jgi:hypothetical protein
MNQYYCKNFCGGSSDFICQNCLLKEISSRKLLNELINRKLVMVQKDRDTGKISGYFI